MEFQSRGKKEIIQGVLLILGRCQENKRKEGENKVKKGLGYKNYKNTLVISRKEMQENFAQGVPFHVDYANLRPTNDL